MKARIRIDGVEIGQGLAPYVIAELSGNHRGELSRALQMLESAASCGVQAVKLQTYRADTITIDHDGPEFRIGGGLWAGRTLYELYEEAHTPWDWHRALFDRARQLGITLFSSPFDDSAVDLLEELGCPAYKIASYEMIDVNLIRRAAATGKPLIISTGLADEAEIEEALDAAAGASGGAAFLYCISGYPTPIEEVNLMTMVDMAKRFNVPVGISDHSAGTDVPVAAVALGAAIVEKHFTISRAEGGVDSAFSLEPVEFSRLVEGCRNAYRALGHVRYDLKPSEQGGREFRRSLYAVRDISAGEALTRDNVRSIRPGLGLHPRHLDQLTGGQFIARQTISKGTPLDWSLVTEPVLCSLG
jgi:pseudaminic acid synthase